MFKKIPGFGERYEINKRGEVFSLPRRVRCWDKGGSFVRPRMRMKHSKHSMGYVTVRLSFGGKSANYCLHSILLMTFVCPRPRGYHSRHLDGNKRNNRLSNLAWGTPRLSTHGAKRFGGQF